MQCACKVPGPQGSLRMQYTRLSFAQKVFTRLQKGVDWPFYRCIVCKVPVVLVLLLLLFVLVVLARVVVWLPVL